MNSRCVDIVQRELRSRGFGDDGTSPNGTITLGREYLEQVDLADLLDELAVRREKVFYSVNVVGADAAKRSYEDVVQAIDAVKCALRRFLQ